MHHTMPSSRSISHVALHVDEPREPAIGQPSERRRGQHRQHEQRRAAHAIDPSDVGTQLTGAVVGVKGSVMTRFGDYGYDLFAGTPVYKLSGFATARVTVDFQLTAQF